MRARVQAGLFSLRSCQAFFYECLRATTRLWSPEPLFQGPLFLSLSDSRWLSPAVNSPKGLKVTLACPSSSSDSLPCRYEQVTKEDLLTNCTQLLCQRLLAPMDLLSLQTACGQRLFSVLSLAWGFIADVDLESEKFRRLGEMRFTLGTCLRLMALRTYRGTDKLLGWGRSLGGEPGNPLQYSCLENPMGREPDGGRCRESQIDATEYTCTQRGRKDIEK